MRRWLFALLILCGAFLQLYQLDFRDDVLYFETY